MLAMMKQPAIIKPGDLAADPAEEQEAQRSAAPPPGEDVVDAQSDVALVKAAREGDMAAYDQLVQRYQERIYATIYHMTSNHEDANDLAQETFIKAYSALKSFKGDSSFYTWIY